MRRKTVAAIIVLALAFQFCFPTVLVLAEELNGEAREAVAEPLPDEEDIPSWGG